MSATESSTVVMPITKEAPARPSSWPGLGKPSKVWVYRDDHGRPLSLVMRFDRPGEEKVIRPATLNQMADGNLAWQLKAPPAPRAIYNLDRLAKNPDAPVLVVEGEKAAEAAAKLFPGWVVTTSGSCTSAGSADWGGLTGRKVAIWPDADEPGAKHAKEVERHAKNAGAVSVGTVALPAGLPEKWDLADLESNPVPGLDAVSALRLLEAAIQPVSESIEADPNEVEYWPVPQPLITKVEARPYPLDALPAVLRDAVAEVQGFVQAPTPLVASAALAAASVAVQARVDIARDPKLISPASLFLLTIADSGERKSTCDGFFTKAIQTYQTERNEAMIPAVNAHAASLGIWESQRAGVKSAIQEAARRGLQTVDLGRKLADLEATKPEPPRVPRLIYQDATPEALRHSLANRWPSGAVLSNEAGIVFGSHGMKADSLMRNLATLNLLWDGAEISTERRSGESFTVRGARLTMGLQVQEATFRAFLDGSGDLPRGSGFMARFLIGWPESTQGSRFFRDPPLSWPGLSAFDGRMAEILNLPVGMTNAGALTPRLLIFTPEAKEAWRTFHDRVERELGEGRSLRDIRDVASKTADNAARLAAIFQVFQHGEDSPVDLDRFERASRIVGWHLRESQRFFGELALPRELSNAVRLERWVVGQCHQTGSKEVSTRDAIRCGPTTTRSKGALDEALRTLKDLDRCCVVQDGKRRMIQIHPNLLLSNATVTAATVATLGDEQTAPGAACRKSRNCHCRSSEIA